MPSGILGEIHKACGRTWADHGGLRGLCPEGGERSPGGVPILKRAGAIRKDVTTFAQLRASSELGDWLEPALDTLASVVWAAMYPPSPAPGEAAATAQDRVAAVAVSVDEFKEQLVMHVAAAIGKRQARRPVRKSTWSGVL